MGPINSNEYPNSDNYQKSSFPVEITPPSVDPDEGDLVILELAEEWLIVLLGAVDQLLLPGTWAGTDFAKREAVNRADLLKTLLAERISAPVDIVLDGDNLKLSIGGNPVGNGIPKADLQTYLDKWIDNTPTGGTEVFQGELSWTQPNTRPKALDFYYGGVGLIAQMSYYQSKMLWQAAGSGVGFSLLSGQSKGITAHNNGVLIGAASGNPTADAEKGYVQVYGSNRHALSVQAATAGYDLARGFDSNGQLMYALTHASELLAASHQGWGYSTMAWRKQFEMAGFWTEDTDAIRAGGVALSINDFQGDHEVMAARFSNTATEGYKLSFFGDVGSAPDDFSVRTDGTAFEKLIDQLDRYGLVDPTLIVDNQPEVLTTYDAQDCNAAWFIANGLANDVTEIFNALPSSSNLISLIVAIIELTPFSYLTSWPTFIAFVAELQDTAVAIEDDFGDLSEFVADMIAADFDWIALKDDVDTYAWDSHTKDVVKAALDQYAAHPDVMRDIILLGSKIPSEACSFTLLPCEDRAYDFRWSGMQGWELSEGSLVFASGVENELNEGDYSVRIYGYFDSCLIKTIKVTYYGATGNAQGLTVYRYTSDGMGGYDQDPIPWQNPTEAGQNVWTIDLAGAGLVFDRMLVRLNENPNYYDNSIRIIEIETG